MNKREAWDIGIAQLAIEFNTQPEVLAGEGIAFTVPALNPGRRIYSKTMPFCEIVTVGQSAVVMADERIWPQLKDWSKDADEPHWLLELPRMLKLSKILEPYGYALTQTFHHYLPTGDFPPVDPPEGLELKWFEREYIRRFYPNEAWPNALQENENPDRPDILALAAMDGERIAGLAGVSRDCERLWQIGIDVRPEYRGRGLGKLLVQGLAHEVQKRGAVPFYGTSLSNIHSQNIAYGCGFRPAWAAVSARKREE